MASSAHNHQPLSTSCGATAAPPPTPSTQPNRLSTSAAADALSRLLHRLPPTLSLPSRLSPPTTSPPLISLSQQNPNFHKDLVSSSSQLGFFQLTHHPIQSQIALSAEQESLSLFDLPREQKLLCFPRNWPFGFDDDEEDGDSNGDSFCFDAHCETESTELSLSSLRGFANSLEKVGLDVIEALSCALGFENPLRAEGARPWSSMMWVSEGVAGNKPVFAGRCYPYIIALQYQIRCRKYSLLADSGWVSSSPEVDSVLVTIGDIAQVWSNGKLKKVRGRPVATSVDEERPRCVSMSLLVTLPMENTISPLLPMVAAGGNDDNASKEVQNQNNDADKGEEDTKLFCSFPLEDYAWRVYHEKLLFKDPLDRYRI